MEIRIMSVVKDRAIDLDSFMEIWPLLSSRDLLQALEKSSGKTISLFIGESQGSRVEILLDVASTRVGVDLGQGVRWGKWAASGDTIQIRLDDGGECRLSSTETGATLNS